MDEKIRKELEKLEDEHQIRIIRQDLPGDALQSARLVLAAKEQKWQEVEKLLEEGADPRICRYSDVGIELESALYYALTAEEFELAGKLFEAGDRLDDLRLDCEDPIKFSNRTLVFLIFQMRCGNNFFYDESKPLSECCRSSAFAQIEKLLPSASQDELDKSIEPTVHRYIHSKEPVYLDILEDLIEKGA